MRGRIIFCPGPFMHPHLQHIHLWFQRKADSNGAYPEGPVLPWPDRCPNIHLFISNTAERSSRAQEVASTLLFKFSRKEMITWHEMRQFQQPHHYTVWQWRFYPIIKTCKKWVMTLSSSMAMYSVMRDIPDATKVPMKRRWVALYLYATGKFSNQLNLEQWAFEYGLPFFDTHCISISQHYPLYLFLFQGLEERTIHTPLLQETYKLVLYVFCHALIVGIQSVVIRIWTEK